METNRANVQAVEAALDDFRRFLAPECRDGVQLTTIYRVRDVGGQKAHWPEPYSKVFPNPAGESVELGTGVYLHFDEDDLLLYVGKAVSLGARLGDYFQYDEGRRCKIVDKALERSCGVRVVPLAPALAFLAPALELYLIERLNPTVNKRGRKDSR